MPATRTSTTNQPPPLEGVNLFASDLSLDEAVRREGGAGAAKELTAFGATLGLAETLDLGRQANESPPKLHALDRKGEALNRVEFHPSYHALMDLSAREGLHCGSHSPSAAAGGAPRPGANVIRAASLYMAAQVDAGHCCPMTMTNAAIPAIASSAALAKVWLPKLFLRRYDPRHVPASEKLGVTIGMGLTEKQAGTDVRANITSAEPSGEVGHYRLYGHKWFLSAPMSDAFLVTAQTREGLSAFFVPRLAPEGTTNGLHFVRLKDKLGNRSNASSEVEIEGASAILIGEEGRGIATMIETITHTRLDCAAATAGLMRRALAEAIHNAEHRHVSGRKLADEPLMAAVLADLALDVEAATALVFRLARAFDRSQDARASAWRRIMTPVTKYWVTKIAPAFVAEAMECLGGNGYVEDHGLARIYREVPVNAIWEGSGSVMALDVLRVLQREPEVAGLVMEELKLASGTDAALLTAHARIEELLYEPRYLEARSRSLVERLAVLAAGTILRAHAPSPVADHFIATRISGAMRQTYGQGIEPKAALEIMRRNAPVANAP